MVKVNARTRQGGAVSFNAEHHAWASYGAGMPDATPLLYSGVSLPDGRQVQCFVNRETGLVVVDVIDRDGKGGCEILRKNV